MRRDAEDDENSEGARRGEQVTDPREVQHGEADLVAGQRDLTAGEVTGGFPAEAVVARRERKSLSTGKGAFLVGAGILLSRIVGVVRQRVFAYFLGTSDAMDAFNAAFRIPNFLQNVFGEGALSASLIPVYAKLLAQDDEGEADRVAWSIFTLLALVVSCTLVYTRFGRHLFAIGSNERTARLCGVRVGATKIAVYTLAAALAGVAGVMEFAKLSVGDPTVGVGFELDVIAAVIIGGGSLAGGKGTIVGTLAGAGITTVIQIGCSQQGLPNWVQQIVTGAIIVGAVGLDHWRRRGATA
jgi:ABC-type xylose transport system permease subunit